MDRVSVIIPTYNREKTLLRAVHSALRQTHAVHEVLVCDDGSTDNSKQLIEGLKESRVKWIDCGRNGMPSIPRNIGIKAAQGEWIAFLDSDDEWLPEKIALQLNALRTSGLLAATTNCNRWTGSQNLGPFFSHNKTRITFADLLPINMNICSSVVVSKALLEKTSLFPEGKEHKAIEDYALWLRLATQTSFAYVNQALVNYFDDPQSSIRSDSMSENETRKIIFDGFLTWVKNKNIVLATKDQQALDRAYEKILKGGDRPTLWKKIKSKFRN